MFSLNDYVLMRLTKQIMNDRLREAAHYRLLREAGLLQPPWPTRWICASLCRVGHLLVAVGRRLERLERAPHVRGAT